MRELLALFMVVVFASSTLAGTVSVVVHPDDVKSSYEPSDVIRIQLVADGYSAGGPVTAIYMMDIDALTTDNGGVAMAVGTFLLPGFGGDPGRLVNSGGILIADILGGPPTFSGSPPDGEPFYEYPFHVPDVPASFIITLGIEGLEIKNAFNQTLASTAVPLAIHVTSPTCPTCPGDSDQDGDVDDDDYYAIQGVLFWADYLNDPYTPGAYLVLPGDPVTGFLWDVCMDVDEDGDIDEDDYYIVQGNLFNACYFWGDCFWYACGDPRFP